MDEKDQVDTLIHYFERLEKSQDELVILVTGHILTEFIINRIIEEKCPISKNKLADHRTYSYAVKLTILKCMNLIPEYLFKNLNKLNKLRNEYAHNIHINLEQIDLSFDYQQSEDSLIQLHCEDPNNPKELKKHLYLVCYTILFNFAKYADKDLKVNISF